MKKTFLCTGPILLLFSVLIMGIQPVYSIQTQDTQKSKVNPAFRIVSTSPNGLVIEYTPTVAWNSITVQGNSYRNFAGTNVYVLGEPGTPQVFKQSIMIGIPPGSEVRIESGGRDIREEVDKPLLPVPFMSNLDGVPSEEYRQNNEAYRSGLWMPDSLTGVGETGWFKDMAVVRLDFHPVQYLPAEKKYRIISRLVVNVVFNNPVTQNKTASNRVDNAIDDYYYKQVIINYDQAKQWRTAQPSAPKLTGSFQSAGRWFKTTVSTEGMYQITGELLQSLGLSLSGIDPSRIRMYNNGGFELPQELDAPRPEELQEIAVRLTGTEDGRFDTQDAIVFYGRPTSGWKYNSNDRLFYHYIHHYQDQNVYWLQVDSDVPGMRMRSTSDITAPVTIRPVYFLSRIFREDEHDKLYESGLEWYADKFNTGDQKNYEIPLPGYVQGSPVNYAITLKGGASGLHQFVVREGNKTILTPSFFSYTESVFRSAGGSDIQNQKSQVSISYQGNSSSSIAFLDWYEVSYRRALEAVDNTLTLCGPDSTGIIEYSVSGFTAQPAVYDITDWQNVRIMPASFQGGKTAIVRDSTKTMNPKTYIITTASQYRKVTELQSVALNDLRAAGNSADFIIITYDDFADALRPFKEMKERRDSLKTEIVRISDVYRQFSGGLMDATAIRDFLKYAYHNWRTPLGRSPHYVLLVGDGDYDFKNVVSADDKNWIPPFEIDSDNELITRCTDDWYVYLTGKDRIMDMAIGRLPVRSVEDVQDIVEKYRHYAEGEDFDQWRTTFTLVADDELTPGDNVQRIHTDQSEELSGAGRS
ncbi:MAG: C25 family cysteine peptidase, partial [Patescibacteria group bacterium]|nr:C25 family cysteine peptidase [Patescibacteria group bacterium]